MLRCMYAASTKLSVSKHLHTPFRRFRSVILRPCTRAAECSKQKGRNVMARDKPKVLVLTGPTGVGKTELSLLLAERLNGEVISADSVQVFTGMDVGSDKLPIGERRGVSHHLIDVLDPFDTSAEYSAGEFHDAAHAAVADVVSRGRTPLVIGGTGFYLRTFMKGKPRGGKGSTETEKRVWDLLCTALLKRAVDLGVPSSTVETLADTAGHNTDSEGDSRKPMDVAAFCANAVKTMLAALEEIDGEVNRDEAELALWKAGCQVLDTLGDAAGAERIVQEKNNWYRLQRAIEIVLTTGKPTSASAVAEDEQHGLYDFRPYFLFRPRIELFRRIDARVEQMVVSGLLDEVHALLKAGVTAGSAPISRAIGYRQALEWLEQITEAAVADESDIKRLASAIQASSRQLAGSQIKFHRGDTEFKWIDGSTENAVLADEIIQMFQRREHCGGCGEAGRLSKEELAAVKRYTTQWTLLEQQQLNDEILQWLQARGYTTPNAM